MPKSVQPVPLDTTVPTVAKKRPRFFALGIGCGAITGLLLLVTVTGAIVFQSERQKPVAAQQAVDAMAGVPIYPNAPVDTEETSNGRAALRTARAFHIQPGDFAETICLRTNDDKATQIIPFYDQKMEELGFHKTKPVLGSNQPGITYVRDQTRVIVEVQPVPGEESKLILRRFDGDRKTYLTKPEDTITPEDLRHAAKNTQK